MEELSFCVHNHLTSALKVELPAKRWSTHKPLESVLIMEQKFYHTSNNPRQQYSLRAAAIGVMQQKFYSTFLNTRIWKQMTAFLDGFQWFVHGRSFMLHLHSPISSLLACYLRTIPVQITTKQWTLNPVNYLIIFQFN